MVEFWSWLLPIVVVAMTEPFELTERRELERPEIAKPVVVAEVPVAVPKVKDWRVVEAKKVCSPLQELFVVVPKTKEMEFDDRSSG